MTRWLGQDTYSRLQLSSGSRL